MIIEIFWHEGHFHISPDPAIITVWTPVEWSLFYSGEPLPKLLWTIYFDYGSAFLGNRFTAITSSSTKSHNGILNAGPAQNPGDWKYGVRLQNETTKAVLGDDDPFLIVRP